MSRWIADHLLGAALIESAGILLLAVMTILIFDVYVALAVMFCLVVALAGLIVVLYVVRKALG